MERHHYAIFSARFAPEVGGVETFTSHLAHNLVDQGDQVTVVTSAISRPAGWEMLPDEVDLLRLPSHSLMGGRLPLVRPTRRFSRCIAELASSGVDRVLVNTRFYGLSLVGLWFASKIGVPAVVLDHGSAYLTLGNTAADAVLRSYEHMMTFLGRRYHFRYAGISKASTTWLQTFGIHTDLVINNAIDAAAFRREASPRDFRRELGVGDGETLVVSVGRLSPEKGSYELVEAARILGDRVKVALAGEGPLREKLEHDLPANVVLLGNLGHADLSALLRDADLFCLPSRSEGFCTSLLEAGAWGLMPVMTHVGGTDEVMGYPARFGVYLDDMRAATVAAKIDDLLLSGNVGHLSALQQHVEQACSWPKTVESLRLAFEAGGAASGAD